MNIFESRPHLRVLRAHAARMSNLHPGQDDGLQLDFTAINIAKKEVSKMFSDNRLDDWLQKKSAKYRREVPIIVV